MAGGQNGKGLEEGLRFIALVFYAVGVFVVVAAVNTPLAADGDFVGLNKLALNAIAGAAVLSAFATLYAPWHRLPRDAFFAVPAAGVVLISVCASSSGGWGGFAYGLYVLPASFGLYFPNKAPMGLAFLVLLGASPLLYAPNLWELAEYAVIWVPIYATVVFVSSYVVREVERKEAAQRASEKSLIEAKARATELRRMVETDGLTGVKNRRSLQARLAEEVEGCRRSGGAGFSLLLMDLDDFKVINDVHGHLVGDEALRLVARVLWEDSGGWTRSPATGARSSWPCCRGRTRRGEGLLRKGP